MNSKKILFTGFLFSVILLVAHIYSDSKGFYDTTIVDIPMHIMGGVVVATLFLCAGSYIGKYFSLKNTIYFVFIIGIFWEIFEIVGGVMNIYENGYIFDTTKDLLMDLLGSFIIYEIINVIVWKKKRS